MVLKLTALFLLAALSGLVQGEAYAANSTLLQSSKVSHNSVPLISNLAQTSRPDNAVSQSQCESSVVRNDGVVVAKVTSCKTKYYPI